MVKRVSKILQTTFILLTIGTTVQAQPMDTSAFEVPVETQIEIINMTGEVVLADRILCGGNCSSYLMNVNKQLVPGVYVINMKTKDTRLSKRLLVK